MGVRRFCIYSISYGGFVGYRMADMYPDAVEKIVIVSSGIGCTEEQRTEHLRKINRDPLELLLPQNPQDLRTLVDLSLYRYNPFKWVPDLFLREFIDVSSIDLEHRSTCNDVHHVTMAIRAFKVFVVRFSAKLQVMCNEHRAEKSELVQYLLSGLGDTDLPVLTQVMARSSSWSYY